MRSGNNVIDCVSRNLKERDCSKLPTLQGGKRKISRGEEGKYHKKSSVSLSLKVEINSLQSTKMPSVIAANVTINVLTTGGKPTATAVLVTSGTY